MVGQFAFNDVSSDTFNLVCKSIKRPLLPAAKPKRIELPGASGYYDFAGHEYASRSLSMRITYIGTSFEELRSRARLIAAWLSTASWAKLVINDEPDKYYLAKVTEELDLASMLEAGEVEVVFDCQPFAYAVEDEVFEFTTAGSYTFTNPGTRQIDYRSPTGSKSLITVIGSWSTLQFVLNGVTLGYSDLGSSQTLVIDNIEMEAELNGVNKFSKLTGAIDNFLTITPGENSLVFSGTNLNVACAISFTPLWI